MGFFKCGWFLFFIIMREAQLIAPAGREFSAQGEAKRSFAEPWETIPRNFPCPVRAIQYPRIVPPIQGGFYFVSPDPGFRPPSQSFGGLHPGLRTYAPPGRFLERLRRALLSADRNVCPTRKTFISLFPCFPVPLILFPFCRRVCGGTPRFHSFLSQSRNPAASGHYGLLYLFLSLFR